MVPEIRNFHIYVLIVSNQYELIVNGKLRERQKSVDNLFATPNSLFTTIGLCLLQQGIDALHCRQPKCEACETYVNTL